MKHPLISRHRGACLLFFSLLDLLYGLSLWRPAPQAAQSPSTRFLVEIMPLPWWGALWLVVGVICLAGALVRRLDQLAFACAGGIKTLWGGVLLLGWIGGAIERGWVGAVVWLAFAALITFALAPWPEPAPRR